MKKSALLTLLFLAAPLMAMDEKDSGGKVEKLKIFIACNKLSALWQLKELSAEQYALFKQKDDAIAQDLQKYANELDQSFVSTLAPIIRDDRNESSSCLLLVKSSGWKTLSFESQLSPFSKPTPFNFRHVKEILLRSELVIKVVTPEEKAEFDKQEKARAIANALRILKGKSE